MDPILIILSIHIAILHGLVLVNYLITRKLKKHLGVLMEDHVRLNNCSASHTRVLIDTTTRLRAVEKKE